MKLGMNVMPLLHLFTFLFLTISNTNMAMWTAKVGLT